jgi:hypothetical protein
MNNNLFAVVGDPSFHYSPDYDVVSKKGRPYNLLLKAASKSLRFALDYCRENDIGTLVMLGDYFELKDKVPSMVRNAFTNVIEKYDDIDKEFLEGNHDRNKQGHCNVKWLNRYGNYICKPEMVGDCALIPYSNDYDAIEKTIGFLKKTGARKLFGHFDLTGAKLSGSYYSPVGVDTELLEDLEQSFIGHIHNAASIGNIHIVGTPYSLDWGELSDKSFMVYDHGKVLRVRIPQVFYRKIIAIIKPDDLKILAAEHSGSNRLIRLDIGNSMLQYLDEIKKNIPECIKVFYNHVEGEHADNKELVISDTVTLEDAFRERVNNSLQTVRRKHRKIYRKVISKVMK